MYFQNISPDGTVFTTFLMKGTFEIDINSEVLKEAKKQTPIEVSDRFRGDPAWTSLLYESDLAPFKPATDICVLGKAFSPEGLPAKSWECGIEVGVLKKTVRVTGPRFWEKEENGSWSLTDPEPCTEVDLSFENAYGGSIQTDDNSIACETNPSGKGFTDGNPQDEITRLPAPQIEDVNNPIVDFGAQHTPCCFSPVAKAWLPRRLHAGTYDEGWKKHKYPCLPDDFNYRFYNFAPEDLVYPGFLKGDEHVILENMCLSKDVLNFRLPEDYFLIFCKLKNEEVVTLPLILDTLVVNLIKNRVTILWRSTINSKPEDMLSLDMHKLTIK